MSITTSTPLTSDLTDGAGQVVTFAGMLQGRPQLLDAGAEVEAT